MGEGKLSFCVSGEMKTKWFKVLLNKEADRTISYSLLNINA